MKNNYKKGFTLIETLVAITVLMIAIAGPLTVASKAYTAATDARSQSMAINYAQEGLEYMNYRKDNLNWPAMVSGDNDGSTWTRGGGTPPKIFERCTSSSMCMDVNIGPNYIDDTNFVRRYYFTTFPGDPNQVLATVVVSWNTGLISNSVQLQEMLTNSLR